MWKTLQADNDQVSPYNILKTLQAGIATIINATIIIIFGRK
jgi:hypothetical protein